MASTKKAVPLSVADVWLLRVSKTNPLLYPTRLSLTRFVATR